MAEEKKINSNGEENQNKNCSRKYTPQERLMCLFRKEFYMIIPNYVVVLIPGASLMAWLSWKYLDPVILPLLGLTDFPIPQPINYVVFGILLILSGLALLWTYSYLILDGEGGPCPPFTPKIKCLVKNGPYSISRHPSILVKLTGVIGLGIAFQSLSFLIIVLPVLIGASLFNNWYWQEKPLIEKFGDEYLEYKKNTPMLFPNPLKIFNFFNS